jgi:hypothetical protein
MEKYRPLIIKLIILLGIFTSVVITYEVMVLNKSFDVITNPDGPTLTE